MHHVDNSKADYAHNKNDPLFKVREVMDLVMKRL
jgi:hypothetical protein